MDKISGLKPLSAGWYSSHWSLASSNKPTQPFIISSSPRVNQTLAALQDLYARAIFLLGLAKSFPGKSASPSNVLTSLSKAAKAIPDCYEAPTDRPLLNRVRPFQSRGTLPTKLPAETRPTKPQGVSSANALKPQSKPGVEPIATPETAANQGEVLIGAVNRLGAALEAHRFLSQHLRQYGADLISRFAQTLSPFGLSGASGSLSLNREQFATAYQENPQQVSQAFWGPHSLTAEITSLAAAIVGAPGVYLMEPASPAPETYQPFRGAHPWFQVAPALFWQVA